MPLHTALRRALRAAGLVLILGAAAMAAAPAQAAPGDPHFNFRIQIPNGPSAQMGNGHDHRGRPSMRPGPARYCLTDRQMQRQLRDYGYFNIGRFRDLPRNRARVEASYKRWVYGLDIDKCTGRIAQRRVRPIGPLPPPRGHHRSGSNLGLQFNF